MVVEPQDNGKPMARDALIQLLAVQLYVKIVDPNVCEADHCEMTASNALKAAAVFADAWEAAPLVVPAV